MSLIRTNVHPWTKVGFWWDLSLIIGYNSTEHQYSINALSYGVIGLKILIFRCIEQAARRTAEE